jgi:hypothetical protein
MRLDVYALLQSVDALESTTHSMLARVVEIRRYLEDYPNRNPHWHNLEQVTEAARLLAKANAQLGQFPIIRP